jgi:hypothetical protein
MTGPDDKNCGKSYYRFLERAKRVRDILLQLKIVENHITGFQQGLKE